MRNAMSAVVLAAGIFVSFAAVEAQTPKPNTEFSGAPKGGSEKMTIIGCLKDERDIPGQKVSGQERKDNSPDFVIVDAVIAPDSKVQGLTLKPMYELEGKPELAFKKHLNHQVQLEGRIAKLFNDDHEAHDLPDFNVTGMKMLAETCPAK